MTDETVEDNRTPQEKRADTLARKKAEKEAAEAEVVEAEVEVIPPEEAVAPVPAKPAVAIRCDYCREHHTTILEPGCIGDTVISLFERDLLVTELPLDKLITNNAICTGKNCGTKVPMRIRHDETTAFLARQGVKPGSHD